MAQFTQLNLGSNAPRDPRKQSVSNSSSKGFSKPLTAIASGVLMAAVFLGVLLLGTNGCSKSDRVAVVAPPVQSTLPSTVPAALPAPTTVAVVKPTKKKKHAKPHMLATYSDATYGVSFRYPDTYLLKTGDEPEKDLAGLGPVQMNFVQPGGATLAAVELPKKAFPGADISSAFFSVSVNPNLSEAECTQFASTDASGPGDDGNPDSKMKVGSLEFNQIEETLRDFDSRYYHIYQNGTCYEFGLGLANAVDGDKRQLTQAEYDKVFDKLEKIFDTVKIEPGVVSETPTPSKETTPVQAADAGKN